MKLFAALALILSLSSCSPETWVAMDQGIKQSYRAQAKRNYDPFAPLYKPVTFNPAVGQAMANQASYMAGGINHQKQQQPKVYNSVPQGWKIVP